LEIIETRHATHMILVNHSRLCKSCFRAK